LLSLPRAFGRHGGADPLKAKCVFKLSQTLKWRTETPARGTKPLFAQGDAVFKRPIFLLIAILSIAASATAEAKPRHHTRVAPAAIVCNDRGCSDHRFSARHTRRVVDVTVRHKVRHAHVHTHRHRSVLSRVAIRHTPRVAAAKAERRMRHERRREIRQETRQEVRQKVRQARVSRDRVGSAVIVCTQQGCSDRGWTIRAETAMALVDARHVVDANGNGTVVGGRPEGCPHAFCGCEASRYVFGEMRRELYLASNWIRKFPRAAPAPGMAAARSGHVMILLSHVGGNDWMVHDGNSGGGKTRDHVMSISRYVIVDPRGSRSAQQ
jgi:hypothetical protein